MTSQACSSNVSLVNQMTRGVLYRFHNLIKFDTSMYRISRRISFKSFLPTCFRYQIHSGIEHGHDLGTTKNHWIRKLGNLKTFCFYLISFNIMVV